MASIGRGKLRCKVKGCNHVRPYWADECKKHRETPKPMATINEALCNCNAPSGFHSLICNAVIKPKRKVEDRQALADAMEILRGVYFE